MTDLMNRLTPRTFCLLLCLFVMACSADNQNDATPRKQPVKLNLTSTAFEAGGAIPRQFTCSSADISPALSWADPPAGTRSFALIVEDPDAPNGTWVHWVLYDLPPTARELPENMAADAELPNGARHGRNDFRQLGYGGPCPPPGPAHRYFFKLYALDAKLGLKPGVSKSDLENAMQGHILAEGELMGRYGR